MKQLMFVGDKPSKTNTDPMRAFKGAKCEQRLNEWIKVLTEGLGKPHINLVNQSADHFGIFICWAVEDGAKIVALGTTASKALRSIPHFKLPHPSGLNRQINDKEFIKKQLELCKIYINS